MHSQKSDFSCHFFSSSSFLFHCFFHLLSAIRLSPGSFVPPYLFAHSFRFLVQRQVWLQHGAAHSKQAAGHCGERSRHGLSPGSRSRADGQLHWTGLHNWGHGHLSGKVCQKQTALGLCNRDLLFSK